MKRGGAQRLTIGQVSRAAGVATTALRYYERAGLLSPTDRSQAGYRLYDEDAVERLAFIRGAQAVGFTLEDIRALLELNGDSPCQQVQALIERRLTEVDRVQGSLQGRFCGRPGAARRVAPPWEKKKKKVGVFV